MSTRHQPHGVPLHSTPTSLHPLPTFHIPIISHISPHENFPHGVLRCVERVLTGKRTLLGGPPDTSPPHKRRTRKFSALPLERKILLEREGLFPMKPPFLFPFKHMDSTRSLHASPSISTLLGFAK